MTQAENLKHDLHALECLISKAASKALAIQASNPGLAIQGLSTKLIDSHSRVWELTAKVDSHIADNR